MNCVYCVATGRTQMEKYCALRGVVGGGNRKYGRPASHSMYE